MKRDQNELTAATTTNFRRASRRAVLPLLQTLEARTLMTATWLSATGDGNWNSTNNWQSGHVPTSGEDVVFAAPGNSNFEHVTLATPSSSAR